NTRLSILYLLGIGLLAGWGLDDLTRERPQGRRAMALCGFALALLLFPVILVAATGATSARFFSRAFEIAWGFAPSPSGFQANSLPIIRLSALITWVVFAGLAALLLYARARLGLRGTVFAVLAVLLVVADLFRAGMGFNPAITDAAAQQPTTPAIRYLQHEGLARFVGVEPYVGINPLPPDIGLRYGLYDARGYDFPVSARFGEMWTRYVAPPTPLLPLDTTTVPYYNLATEPATLRILSLLGVRNIMLEKGQPALHLAGVRVGYDGSDAVIYTNDNALPRTWLVSAQVVVANDNKALTTIGSAGFDPRRQVVTEQALPGLAKGGTPAEPGSASISTYSAQRVVIHTTAQKASELVLSDTWFPGWNATVDGRAVPINRVDYTLRGVAVPAGRHTVVFQYAPSSFRSGVSLSLIAALLWLLAVAVAVGRRIGRGRRRAPPRRRGGHVSSGARRHPKAVASTGPANVGSPTASAVSWQSRRFREPPPPK
ncbi:MAG TPA: YfhO family protein, partial [Acidimicrobiales bacterium]|nr:YfhO family protein [Acidimicrobiales bacterium]